MDDDRALPAFTIFTITYQRTAELGRLFASLCRQTCKDFVWLIVSDEANDATRQAVDQWRGQADFDIDYVELAHRGKTRAMREGFRHVHTPLMIDIDDDDELMPHCVAVFKEAWQAVERQGRADIGMINALSVDDEDEWWAAWPPNRAARTPTISRWSGREDVPPSTSYRGERRRWPTPPCSTTVARGWPMRW